MSNLSKAFKAFWTVLTGKEYLPEQISSEQEVKTEEPTPAKEAAETTAKNSAADFENGAIYTLLLLQREGRMIDFLQEDISAYDDSQIGAAVRQIHEGSRKVLQENFDVIPVINEMEGNQVQVAGDYDPSETTLVGSHPSEGPYKGTLQHKGWKALKVSLPTRTGDVNEKVIYPAEVSF